MITEEDVKRFAEAKTCKDCLGWHKYCKSECCRSIKLNINPEDINNIPGKFCILKIGKPLSPSDQRYYSLHDVRYTRNTLRFRKDRIHVIGRNVFYFHSCSMLDNNGLCSVHGVSKPKMCESLTIETAQNLNGNNFAITDNCLFKYKEKGGSNNGE